MAWVIQLLRGTVVANWERMVASGDRLTASSEDGAMDAFQVAAVC